VLPTEHHDERVGEVIEAFLDGPPERPHPSRERPQRTQLRSVPRQIPLDTRSDWDVALRHEDARMARYRRPASVLVVRLRAVHSGTEDLFATRVGRIIREHVRETDRVARAAADRFHVLLPETEAAEASALAERIREACVQRIRWLDGDELGLRTAAGTPSQGETLLDALRSAQATVGD
jgi:GGDEF domain-containing protein